MTVTVQRFNEIGLSISPEKIYSPIDSINQYIIKNNISNVMVVGSDDEICQIQANHTLVNPELIILLDFEKNNFGYNDLQVIINNLNNENRIISASGSPYYLKNGRKIIDTGAFVSLLESITDQKIEILGKPSSQYFQNAQRIFNENLKSITVIGDDWKTDIMGAKNVGYNSILMRSGKYKLGDEKLCNPDSVIDNFLTLIP
ncbi:hypothetical protein EW093_08580 [Thiospirochaeta perfilievii]|uniref:TIGR01458 family HAD-type hydrolase n=1 Tax=Thiospirochaeta perfilievii TaxID=252967 RepID=A0A5C1QB83_9SPIO|nr:HAD hydrolase-like protein [Thiospirochaeta perfilievii]QEN04757.1 hypothetical protein EW093_08580 [Thiospirochaeta perfilievii]